MYFPIGLLSSWLGLTASLQRGKTPISNKYPGYDIKQSDDEVPVILELWAMRSTPSWPHSQVNSGLEW